MNKRLSSRTCARCKQRERNAARHSKQIGLHLLVPIISCGPYHESTEEKFCSGSKAEGLITSTMSPLSPC